MFWILINLAFFVSLAPCFEFQFSVRIFIFSEPPVIPEETPRNATSIESQRVTLPCPASGTPPPLITWYKDGREITGTVHS